MAMEVNGAILDNLSSTVKIVRTYCITPEQPHNRCPILYQQPLDYLMLNGEDKRLKEPKAKVVLHLWRT